MKFASALVGRFFLSCAIALLVPIMASAQMTASSQMTGAQIADEIRQYDVIVKDKPVGNVSIRISQASDGTTTTTTDTSIQATFLFITYRYEFHGKEVWQGDRLVQTENRVNDNGTPLTVQAVSDARGSQIDVQGKASRTVPPLAMTANYWRLPSADFMNAPFSMVEPDTGILRTVRLQFVGSETVAVEGHGVLCNHYRLSGELSAELWFDGEGRMVRQQTVEQGYPTEQHLVRIHNEPHVSASGPAVLTGYQK
jgi:hypothetical protein